MAQPRIHGPDPVEFEPVDTPLRFGPAAHETCFPKHLQVLETLGCVIFR
jgi:hypothetical protein